MGKIPKWVKIVLWILGVLVALIVALLLSLNTITRKYLITKVDQAIASTDSMVISYRSIDLDVYKGEIRIKGVVFQTDTAGKDSVRAYSRLEVGDAWLQGVNYLSLFVHKEIDLTGLEIDNVRYTGVLDTKAMQANDAANAVTEEERRQFQQLLRQAQRYLNRVTLRKLILHRSSASIRALETGLDVEIPTASAELYDLGYSLVDSIPFHYNNTNYHFAISSFNMVMPDSMMNLSVGELYAVPSTHSLVVQDVLYATDTVWHSDRNFHTVKIDTIRLDSINLPDMKTNRSLSFKSLRIINPTYYGCIDDTPKKSKEPKKELDLSQLKVKSSEAKMLAELQYKEQAMMNEQSKMFLKTAQMWLDHVNLGTITVENATAHLKSYKSQLDVKSKGISVAFHDLGYSLVDKIPYHFSDKRYSIAVGRTEVTLPDGMMSITCNGVHHANCGPITIGRTRVWNTVDKWRLAHLRGDVSSTWIDITMDTFFTSRISPFSTVYNRKLALDNVTVGVGEVNIFSDNRNLTVRNDVKIPSKQSLLEIMDLLSIGHLNVGLRRLDTEVAGHYSGTNHITMENALVSLSHKDFQRLEADDINITFPDSPMRLHIGGIHTNHKTHDLVVSRALFVTDDHCAEGEQYHKIYVDSIVLAGIMLPDIVNEMNQGDVAASCLRIVHPQYTGYIDEKPDKSKRIEDANVSTSEAIVDRKLKAYQQRQQRQTLAFLQQWLDGAQLDKIQIERGDFNIKSVRSGFTLRAKDLSLYTSGIGFNLGNFIPINISDTAFDFDPIKANFKLIGNSAISYLALRDLRTTLPDSSMYLNVRKVDTDRKERSLIISGIEFATDTVVPKDEMYHHATLETLRIDGVMLPDLKARKEATVGAIRIIDGHYHGIINTGAKPKQKQASDTLRYTIDQNGDTVIMDSIAIAAENARKEAKQKKTMKIIGELLEGGGLNAISIENLSADITDLSSDLKLQAEGLGMKLNDLSYSIEDNRFDYNDSVYMIGLKKVRCLLPDSSMYIETRNFSHANRGPISLGRTRMYNTVDKWQIAHLHGDVPTTWMSMVLDTFHTSAVNPMQIVSSSFKLRLDSLTAIIDTMYIFRDMRYKPKVPYKMPQAGIMAMPQDIVSRFSIKRVEAGLNTMLIEMAMSDKSVPHLEIDSIRGTVRDIDLRRGQNLNVEGTAVMGGGHARVKATIGLKPEYPWSIALMGRGIDLSCLDSLLYPIAGMTMKGTVTDLRAIYSGDSINAAGNVLLAYNGFSAEFHKGSPSPVKFIQKNPKFLTWCVKAFIPKSNPRRAGRLPYAYKAKWKNNVWSPSATFMMGPFIKGAIETMLPGIFASKRVPLDQVVLRLDLK